ncbi:MAG: hypothetical protein Kow0031_35190 [Anaerolineae bacterium]
MGPKLVDCPYRADGGCPFEAASSPPGSKVNAGCLVGVLLFLVLWLGGATLGFTNILLNSQSVISSLLSLGALAVFWIVGLFGLAFVLFALFGKNVTLYNPQSGVMARYATIFGRAFGGGVSGGWEALPPELSTLSLREPLRYPPSWSAWLATADDNNRNNLATFICAATLLALVAENRLALHLTTSHDTLLGLVNRQRRRTLFTPTGETTSSAAGLLEQKILAVFAAPPPSLQQEAWIPGAPVEASDLIAAIYDKDQLQPQKWLVEQVEADLLANNVGRKTKAAGISGWLRSTLEIDPAHQKQLAAEYQLLKAMAERLTLAQPDFMKTLRDDIEQAFKARTESSD